MTTTTGSRTALEELAGFVVRASWDDMSDDAREALKIRVLDAIACALGALHAETPQAIRAYVGRRRRTRRERTDRRRSNGSGSSGVLQQRPRALPGLQR